MGGVKDTIVNMSAGLEFFDIGRFFKSSTGNESNSKRSAPHMHEDFRSVSNNRVYIRDSIGTEMIYDAALQDMENFEYETKIILTNYINRAACSTKEDSHQYLDEMKPKISKYRGKVKQVTFLNPQIDRSQLILEFFESHVDYQNTKIDVSDFNVASKQVL